MDLLHKLRKLRRCAHADLAEAMQNFTATVLSRCKTHHASHACLDWWFEHRVTTVIMRRDLPNIQRDCHSVLTAKQVQSAARSCRSITPATHHSVPLRVAAGCPHAEKLPAVRRQDVIQGSFWAVAPKEKPRRTLPTGCTCPKQACAQYDNVSGCCHRRSWSMLLGAACSAISTRSLTCSPEPAFRSRLAARTTSSMPPWRSSTACCALTGPVRL